MKNYSKITIILILMFLCHEMRANNVQPADTPLYKNPSFPIEQRIDDLISRMTLEEKVGQMNIPCCYKTELGWGLGSETASSMGKSNQRSKGQTAGRMQEMG